MSKVLLFDVATGDILDYNLSANTPEYVGKADAIINPDPALMALGLDNLKVKNGVLVEATAQEKADKQKKKDDAKINPFDTLVALVNTLVTRVTTLEDEVEKLKKAK